MYHFLDSRDPGKSSATIKSARALLSVRALAAHALALEEDAENAKESAQSARHQLSRYCSKYSYDCLLDTLKRHRLAPLLAESELIAHLSPELSEALKHEAFEEGLAALALFSTTRRVLAQLSRRGVEALVIKGVALSLLTTGTIHARGGGDLDLFVNPDQLKNAVEALESIGFYRTMGQFPQKLDSVMGRYSRWCYNQFSMIRENESYCEVIDLHWAMSNARGELPDFREAWRKRETVNHAGTSIPTLNKQIAFRHACINAAGDRWMSLRSLVDIVRLTRINRESLVQGAKKENSKVIRLTSWAIRALMGTECPSAPNICDWKEKRTAIRMSYNAQLLPARQLDKGSGDMLLWLRQKRYHLSLTASWWDKLRLLMFFTIPPRTLTLKGIGSRIAKTAERYFCKKLGSDSTNSTLKQTSSR